MRGEFVVGAYAAAGDFGKDDRAEWYALLAGLDGVGGIEVPVGGLSGLPVDLPEGWHVVCTLLPATFTIGKSDHRYGLASTDADGRRAALRDASAARDEVLRLADALGRAAVSTVQIHSAPSRRSDGSSSAESFRASVAALAQLDWSGAELVIEHCDAAVPDADWQKGYLALADETRVALDTGVGQSVNWGRSAIEGRSAQTALDHLAETRESGTLRGLMLSGAAGTDGPFGAAWRDVHNPVADVDAHSLLDDAAIRAAVNEAGDDLAFIGVKVKASPGATTPAERVEGLRATVAALDCAWAARAQLIA